MKISVNKTVVVTFAVEAYWNEEGGMGYTEFANNISTLEEAINKLEVARSERSHLPNGVDWIITADVVVTHGQGKG